MSVDPGPDDVVATRQAVSLGLLVMMESLSPLERAVFVLRRAFNWPYDEIADILDRSPEAVRQLDHRARQHLSQRRSVSTRTRNKYTQRLSGSWPPASAAASSR